MFKPFGTNNPPFGDFITVRFNIIIMGTGYIAGAVIACLQFHPPPVGKIALYKNQIVLKISNPYMIFNKSA